MITKDQVKAAIKKGKTLDDAAELLGTSRRQLLRLRQKFGMVEGSEFVEPINQNLADRFTGKFKEQSDKTHRDYKRFVITSIQNDTKIDKDFYKSLINYCRLNQAKLLVVPVYYNFHDYSRFNIDEDVLFFDNIQMNKHLKLLSRLKILPTIVDPFAGLDGISKGDSIIIPHPQVAMKTMATLGDSPAQMYTTGSISLQEGIYAKNKTGYKAEFNHSVAALVVEFGQGDSFHIRGLNSDDKHGFYDISGYYSPDKFTHLTSIEAIYTGDEHASVADPKVVKATYLDANSIVKTLKPKLICRGDVFDAQSVSHHDDHDYLTRYGKAALGLNSVEKEFDITCDFIKKTTPPGTKNLIIGSNHNDHLYKWLTTCDPHKDLTNAKIYHKLSYLLMDSLEKVASGISYPNLLELWINNSQWVGSSVMQFLGRRQSYKILGVEVSMHGDKGINGAKGSPIGFSRLPVKSIVGHSHSPSIRLGCYTVGTSSLMDLSYTGGASSWMHTHCVIYPNGKRQLINIINGKWHA